MGLFLCSVIMSIIFKDNIIILLIGYALLLLLLYLKYKKVFLLIIGLGYLFGLLCTLNNPTYKEKEEYIGIVYERKDNYFLFHSDNGNYYIYSKDHHYEMFDILKIEGKQQDISFSTYEGEFDFNSYLYNKKVEKEIIFSNIEFQFYNPIRKKIIIDKFLSNFNLSSQQIISKLLFNKNDNDFGDDINTLQLTSYFTLSGIQLFFIYSVLNKIILYLTNKKKISKKISLCLLFPLLMINNYKLSFLKNYILLLNKDNQKIKNSDVLIILLLIVLVINYRFIYTTSFIYIFVVSFLARIINKFVNKYPVKNRSITRIVFFSLLINIISLFINGKCNLLTVLLIPVILLISQGYIILVLLTIIFPLQILVDISSNIIIEIVSFLSNISLEVYINSSLIYIILLIIIVMMILYFTELRLFKINNILIAIHYFIIGIGALPFDSYFSKYITFINVGQGDCALIHDGSTNILIDVGGSIYKDIGNDILIPYFNKYHIYNIDTIFISHNDYDHIGSLESLVNNFMVGEVIIGSSFYEKQVGNINIKNLNQYNVGSEDNDNSSVLYFNFLNINFLFMGDAGINIERKIMNDYHSLDVDVIKIGHHGSSTSSSYQFLKWINPKEAVISVGKNNYYNHPNEIVIKYLLSLNINIRRTDIEGSIVYY